MTREKEEFAWKGTKDKMKFLASEYSFQVPEDWRDLVLSIVQGRNRLVHRDGIVGHVDGDETGHLVVKWVRIRPFAGTEGKMREAKPNEWIGPGELLAMTRHPTTKSFPIGATVDFTAEEFQDVCYALVQFGRTLQGRLERYRRDHPIA